MVKSDDEIDTFDETTPFVYIFVRKDLPRIHQTIQASHAAHEAGIEFGKIDGQQSHFCIFGVKDEEQLMAAAWQIEQNEIKHSIFHEPDFDMGYTALATEPIAGEKRLLFKNYSLLR